jgi:predicted phosphohydrolase
MNELENKYKQITNKYSNVFLLNNSFEKIDENINIYGSTFWTGTEELVLEEKKLLSMFSDYNMIYKSTTNNETNKKQRINIKYIDDLSKQQLVMLKDYLEFIKNKNTHTIVMTHFPPIRENSSNPKYLSQPEYVKNYFSWNNIYKKIDCKNIIGWISGHTHWSYDIKIEDLDTRFVSNQFGYKKELLTNQTNFDENKIFEFEI